MPPKDRTSLLCPGCRKLISADEPVCPYCGLSRPGGQRHFFLKFSGSALDITRIIIYLNIGFYILSLIVSSSGLILSPNPFTFLAPSEKGLFILGATGTIPINLFGRWWTLVSASFLHGGLMHILFNMQTGDGLGRRTRHLRPFGTGHQQLGARGRPALRSHARVASWVCGAEEGDRCP